jgi:uncharacterized protein (DUF362 family)/Pyruvate/2-oxoacid:ferredoxin oxidoreductase delta subunit
MSRFVKPGMRVLLKPNLLAARKPEQATTTHPTVMAAVAKLVRQAGGQAVIADSPGGPYTPGLLRGVYAATGAQQAAADAGAQLNEDTAETDVAVPGGKLLKRVKLIAPVAQADLVINLPKLKTHGQMVYTGAVKNMFGAIAGTGKIDYHMRMPQYDVFADMLVDVCLAARPALTIMDAVEGMEGAGPSAGNPRQIGLVLAGEDPFAIDRTALDIVGASPLDVPVMLAAHNRGLCPSRQQVQILGPGVSEVAVAKFDMPGAGEMAPVQWTASKVMAWLSGRIKPRPVFDHATCTGCGQCAQWCPPKVITMAQAAPGQRPEVDLEGCIRCFCCQEICPAKAVSIRRLGRRSGAFWRMAFFGISLLGSRMGRRR